MRPTSWINPRRTGRAALLLAAIGCAQVAAETTEPITVTGRAPPPATTATLGEIDRDALDRLRPVHASELRLGAPGLWVSRGSGQEHLTAIRSPVLTGAGACGAFAFLDNGVPVRPVGLCNVNQLFELNLWQADRVTVTRGPSPLNPAAGGLHGAINVNARADSRHTLDVLGGPDDFFQLAVDTGVDLPTDGALRLRTRLAHDGGFRADAGFDQGHLNLDAALPAKYGAMHAHIAAAALQQETAGFVRGFDAFRQPAVARSNPNPEAFRDAWAVRGGLTWTPGRWTLRPFFRRSQMAFLQHFLPGQPLEVNAQTSGGLSLEHRLDSGGPLTLTTRALVEASEMSLREDQAEPVSFGSAFLRATRPAGRHYDFSVDGLAATLTGALAWRAGERQTVEVGLRLDGVRYRYRTRLTAGNNDDQGNPCGFGGCLFTRPDDRSDRFFEWAPSVRWRGALSSRTSVFASLARGVRMPQITELYRLQSGQTVADLSPEVIDSVELGVAHSAPRQRWQITSFAAIKRNGIFRDADGFNVNAARTLHAGAELDGRIELHPRATLSASVTLAAHRYRFDRLTGGEPIRRNDDVDTAPRTLGNVGLTLTPIGDLELHLEWEHMGSYWLDAANAHRYGGHDLVHANLRRSVGDWTLGVKLRNVMNRAFAERADFAFGQYRYFPGQPRSAYVWVSRRL